MHKKFMTAFGFATAFLASPLAHAEDAPEREAEASKADPHAELKARIEEERLRGQYERVLRENEAARHGDVAVVSMRAMERRRLIFPGLFGVDFGGSSRFGLGVSVGPFRYSDSSLGITSARTLSFTPSADVVLPGGWTLGGTVIATRTTSRPNGATVKGMVPTSASESLNLGAAPRVGLLVPLGGNVTFWPQIEGTMARARSEYADAERLNLDSVVMTTTLGVSAKASVLFPLTRHLYAELGTSLGYVVSMPEGVDRVDESFSVGTSGGLGLAF